LTLLSCLQALESEIKYNAKLDILTRLQADDRANGTPGTNSTYDDSDEEEEEESFASEQNSQDVEEEEEEEVEVEKMLLDGEGDVSIAAEVSSDGFACSFRTLELTSLHSPTAEHRLPFTSRLQDLFPRTRRRFAYSRRRYSPTPLQAFPLLHPGRRN